MDEPDSIPEPSKGRRKCKKGEHEDEDDDGIRESLTAENYLQRVLVIILTLLIFDAEITCPTGLGPSRAQRLYSGMFARWLIRVHRRSPSRDTAVVPL
jgi:hypothetical protein